MAVPSTGQNFGGAESPLAQWARIGTEILRHPSLLATWLSTRSVESVRSRYFDLRMERAPWPEVRRRTEGKAVQRFGFRGQQLPYFYHPYNHTWLSERTVEVPIARAWLNGQPDGPTIEVGNVLSHYFPVERGAVILDKHEVAPGVTNEDILTFTPAQSAERIVSISTLEHVGWDSPSRDAQQSLQAVQRIRSWLAPSGKALITFPMGYNPELHRAALDGSLGANWVQLLRRTSMDNVWQECDPAAARDAVYVDWRTVRTIATSGPYPAANVLAVAELPPA
jgi:hypothetical protein